MIIKLSNLPVHAIAMFALELYALVFLEMMHHYHPEIKQFQIKLINNHSEIKHFQIIIIKKHSKIKQFQNI